MVKPESPRKVQVSLATLAALVILATGGCSRQTVAPDQRPASLADIGSNPSDYEIGRELSVTGWLIEPPRSVLFICDEISDASPPRATGECSEVENKGLLKDLEVMQDADTTWVPDRVRLNCTVAGHWPSEIQPERLSLICGLD